MLHKGADHTTIAMHDQPDRAYWWIVIARLRVRKICGPVVTFPRATPRRWASAPFYQNGRDRYIAECRFDLHANVITGILQSDPWSV
jgi:hypothetical protein